MNFATMEPVIGFFNLEFHFLLVISVTSFLLKDCMCVSTCMKYAFKNQPMQQKAVEPSFFQPQHVKQHNGLSLKRDLKGIFIVAEICCRPSQECKQCRDIFK